MDEFESMIKNGFTNFSFHFFLLIYSTEGSRCLLHDGTEGVCENLNSCQWIIDNLSARRMTQRDIKLCSFKVICHYRFNYGLNFNEFDWNSITFSKLGTHRVRMLWRSTTIFRASIAYYATVCSRRWQYHFRVSSVYGWTMDMFRINFALSFSFWIVTNIGSVVGFG